MQYVMALGLYWNLVMAICFASPLLITLCCWHQPLIIAPTLLYMLWARFLSRGDLADGSPWRWFSIQEWGYHAFRRYLRLRIHVHSELSSLPHDRPAVLAVHPHGVASDYRILLDGMLYEALPNREVLTLSASVLFCIPMVRELALWTRCIDARKSVASRALRKGHSVMVIPGGEQEQIRTEQGKEEVFLSKRVGFIKLALEQQSAVVPCYAFGSVDLYATYTKVLFKPREWLRKTLGVCIPVYLGALGFLPLRRPVHLVLGRPLQFSCQQPGKPTDQEVQQAHQQYMDALRSLYEEDSEHFCWLVDGSLVVTNKWQKWTDLEVSEENLKELSQYCDEFLVHGVDVEGLQSGIEEPLVRILAASPIPVTYAGGVRSLEDMERIRTLGQDRVDATIGSALDIFGGKLPYDEVVRWHNKQLSAAEPPKAT
ncbi:unnamed protein product [Effrenium voratum]|uniref:Acyltransferase n=1 Tax=Effrenium voratum TaxID=2562239 RepID=A0AA36JCH4_9DINO|nr:unnamed protein product [Effrenium voratum]